MEAGTGMRTVSGMYNTALEAAAHYACVQLTAPGPVVGNNGVFDERSAAQALPPQHTEEMIRRVLKACSDLAIKDGVVGTAGDIRNSHGGLGCPLMVEPVQEKGSGKRARSPE